MGDGDGPGGRARGAATSNAQAFGLIAEGGAAWLTEDVAALTGNAPRSLRTFLAEHITASARAGGAYAVLTAS